MNIETGSPLSERRLAAVKAFLEANGLRYEVAGTAFTVNITGDDGAIMATGSLEKNVIKCVAVSPEHQGDGLAAVVVGTLVKQAVEAGISRLFVFSKPENRPLFTGLGFYPVAETAEAVLLENERDGVKKFVRSLENPKQGGIIGAVVANCNPFTNGHLYLMEQASRHCGLVHVFVVSEDQSEFPAAVRFELVRQGVAHLKNVLVHPTGDYLVSAATFPTYFHKDKALSAQINCELDLAIFAECFAAPLGITKRFVGEEPFCPVTGSYNRQMKQVLPRFGIEVIELARCTSGGEPISASRVRALLKQGRLDEIRELVPRSTFDYLERMIRHDPQ